ncbi:MAG TPA: S8 family serine peptidase [Pyrinomonadaceae bacterium]|nr:S8 family serine peptidase [Pyrinomonadaceae bacterium]
MTKPIAVHDHYHSQNRFAVIPTHERLDADPNYDGSGVTVAFLDSGFYPHPDLVEPTNRILAFKDVTGETNSLDSHAMTESWRWHGTQTSVVASGNGQLSDGTYKGLASEAAVVLVKASEDGRISEDNIARGIEWIIENRERYNIRVLNISLGGDEDVPCSKSIIDQAAEEAIKQGIVVVTAAGNSGNDGRHSIPPANSPSVITVGGYNDNNQLNGGEHGLYQSNFGATADGSIKPEIIAPAMWVAAPILPGTALYHKAEALSHLASAPDYQLSSLVRDCGRQLELPRSLGGASPDEIRKFIELLLNQNKIVATHYQHVDGTSFAAPIVSSIAAQMIQVKPRLTPGAVKNILVSTSDRIANAPAIRQGYGVVNARRAVALAKTEQHALKTVGCGPPRIVNGRLVFVFHHDEAQSVSLAGDFNAWDAPSVKLAKDGEGLWQTQIAAPPPGVYQYKFLVDGDRWLEDPSNGMKAPDNFGGMNSVLVIE